MSFFIKPRSANKQPKLKGKKRKFEEHDEVSSEEEEEINSGKVQHHSDESDEEETAQDKKIRLAKIYLEEIERQEKLKSKGDVSQRLKEDYLKTVGKHEVRVADTLKLIGTKFLKCKEQRNTVTCVCVSPINNCVFSGSKDGAVIKWSIKETKRLGVIPFVKQNIDEVKGHTGCINSLAISMDNRFLVVGDSSNFIQVWNPDNLTHIGTLKGHRKPVTGLGIQQNTHTLFSGSNDRTIRVWNLDEMSFVETLFGHQHNITSIDILNSDRPISAGCLDGSIRIWKTAEESQLVFNTHHSNAETVKYINEQHFISGSNDGQFSIWSTLKKKSLFSIKEAHGSDSRNGEPNWITAVAAYPHSDVVASGSCDGCIRFWKVEDRYRKISPLFEVPIIGSVNSLIFTADGKHLVAGIGKDHRFGRWKTFKEAVNGVFVINLESDVTK